MKKKLQLLFSPKLEFTYIWIGLFCVVFGFVVFVNFNDQYDPFYLSNTFVNLMYYYLGFTIIRAIILLILSAYENMSHGSHEDDQTYPLISIIIPCYNEGKTIQRSIRAVELIDYPNFEILVVDDGSIDDTFEKVLELKKSGSFRVRLITKPNGGKWHALNWGISEALGDYILCMDADTQLNKDVLKKMIPFFKQDPLLAAVAGNIQVGRAEGILEKFQKLEYIIGLNLHKSAQSALNSVTIVPGPIGLFKKKVLEEVGGYEEGTYAEDCDLTIKLLLNGHHIKYCPDAIAVTEAPKEILQFLTQRYRWSRGTIQAIIKNAGIILRRKKDVRNIFIIFYLLIEAMIIPTLNFIFLMTTIILALHYNIDQLYGPFFVGLTLVDVCLALYSVIFEKNLKSLFVLALISRLTYGLALELIRFYSMIDEVVGVPMKWGELKRTIDKRK